MVRAQLRCSENNSSLADLRHPTLFALRRSSMLQMPIDLTANRFILSSAKLMELKGWTGPVSDRRSEILRYWRDSLRKNKGSSVPYSQKGNTE